MAAISDAATARTGPKILGGDDREFNRFILTCPFTAQRPPGRLALQVLVNLLGLQIKNPRLAVFLHQALQFGKFRLLVGQTVGHALGIFTLDKSSLITQLPSATLRSTHSRNPSGSAVRSCTTHLAWFLG